MKNDVTMPLIGEKAKIRKKMKSKKYHSFILEIDIIKVVKRGLASNKSMYHNKYKLVTINSCAFSVNTAINQLILIFSKYCNL